MIENTSHGRFKITAIGSDYLSSDPSELNLSILRRYPAFRNFRGIQFEQSNVEELNTEITLTPEEQIATSYQTLRNSLAQDLLEKVKVCDPNFFENLVLDLLVAMGYGGSMRDAQNVGRSGDGGIDGIIKEDRLGLDIIYVQAKRWQGAIPSHAVRDFIGALTIKGAKKGVFIATSKFPAGAVEQLSRANQQIILIDGEQLAGYMIDYGVGVKDIANYTLKKIDLDYFIEE